MSQTPKVVFFLLLVRRLLRCSTLFSIFVFPLCSEPVFFLFCFVLSCFVLFCLFDNGGGIGCVKQLANIDVHHTIQTQIHKTNAIFDWSKLDRLGIMFFEGYRFIWAESMVLCACTCVCLCTSIVNERNSHGEERNSLIFFFAAEKRKRMTMMDRERTLDPTLSAHSEIGVLLFDDPKRASERTKNGDFLAWYCVSHLPHHKSSLSQKFSNSYGVRCRSARYHRRRHR